MYLCRIRFRETISKISFNMSAICINYQLTLRESLTRVTNYFQGDFGLLLPQFNLYAFQTLMVNSRELALKVWPDPKNQRIQIGERWGPFLFGNEVRNILWKQLLSLFGPMWWCRVLLKRPGTVFEVFSCTGQQCTNKDVISIVLLVQFHPLINKK